MHKAPLLYLAFSTAVLLPTDSFATTTQKPKLIVQITVDGLRGDLLERYKSNFGQGGFNYLMDQGTYYNNAHFQHGNTETIVGHVSLATGAPPSVHGMIGNVWYDRSQERLVYNVEDGNYNMLTAGSGVDQSTEIDPTQRVATQDGRSPSPILATTFSDELAISSGGESKIFSVSIKDRGAISLAGHSGKAFWFSKFQSEFVTSDYYYDQYPTWVNDWNQKGVTEKYSSTRWQLSLPAEKYTLQETQQHFKVDLGGFKRTFPHPYGPSSYPYFSTMLTLSPAGDEITADFASSLLEHEALGQGKATDYLAISFSSNDYVIHMYGPASLETEDNLIRLDRTIADLLDNIDQKVGLDNTLIVLSADHGVPEAPATVNQLGSPQAQYFQQDTLISSDLLTRMDKEFGLNKDAIRLYAHPYIYLNHTVIKDKGVELEKLQNMMAEELMKVKGIAYAVTSTSIEKNRVPDTQIMTMVKNNYHPKRSGDIYIIYEPRSYINDMEGLTIASMHGSPWRYDTHVPIIFSGYSINSKNISREVTPYAIAPTLSNILGITQPSGSIGEVLPEVTN